MNGTLFVLPLIRRCALRTRCAVLAAVLLFAGISAAGAASSGVLQINSIVYTPQGNGGSFAIAVSRVNGKTGAVGVNYSTSDGTALAGKHYQAASGTLSWADRDAEDKVIAITVLGQPASEGVKTLTLTLDQPTGGATLGDASTTLAINYDAAAAQPTIALASPPANITVTAGDTVPLAASVSDPAGVLSKVRFLLEGQSYGEIAAPGPYVLNIDAPAPGDYQLVAMAIDNMGRRSSSQQTLTVAASDPAHPPPAAAILTPLDGRALLAGSEFTLSASASGADGQELQQVDFYADGTLFASFQPGQPPVRAADGNGRRLARSEARGAVAGSSLYQAAYTMPGVDKLVSIISVALDKAGHSKVSAPVTVQSVASTADRPPAVALKGVSQNTQVPVGKPVSVPVSIVDPDAAAASSAAFGRGPVRRAFDVSGIIAQVEYFLNDVKVKDSKDAPYQFDFTLKKAGSYVLTAVATDEGGLSTVSDPVTIEGVSGQTAVTVSTLGDGIAQEGGKKAKVLFTRTGGTDSDLTVYYKTRGTGVNGVDYEALSGTLVIPAGAQSFKLKIKPIDDAVNKGTRKVNIQLLPSPTGDYDLGDVIKAKTLLLDND